MFPTLGKGRCRGGSRGRGTGHGTRIDNQHGKLIMVVTEMLKLSWPHKNYGRDPTKNHIEGWLNMAKFLSRITTIIDKIGGGMSKVHQIGSK